MDFSSTTQNDTTYRVATNPSSEFALPLVDDAKTQVVIFRFDIDVGDAKASMFPFDAECQICMIRSENFKVAPCGHYACRACVDKIAAGEKYKCPFCRDEARAASMVVVSGTDSSAAAAPEATNAAGKRPADEDVEGEHDRGKKPFPIESIVISDDEKSPSTDRIVISSDEDSDEE